MTQNKLTRHQLYSLEEYNERRPEFRSKVIRHKANRILKLGDNVTLHFEDSLTIQYQIQEILRVERIFDAAGIEEELEAYNPLVPDGSNWKATLMIEYQDENLRRQALTQLLGIEDKVWVKTGVHDKVYAIADEDLDRETDTKTSAVHFLRFELSNAMKSAVLSGESISVGIEHANYRYCIDPIEQVIRDSLATDLS